MVTQSYPKNSSDIIVDNVNSEIESNNGNYNNEMRKPTIAAWRTWNEWLLAFALIVSAIAGLLAAAVAGTAIYSYRTFVLQMAMKNPWWLPLWPQHFDPAGTKTLIGVGCTVLVLNVVFIIFSALPKVCAIYNLKAN